MPLRGHVLWLTPRRARAPGGGSRFGLRASARTAGRPGRPPAGLIRPARSVPQVASRAAADGSPRTEVACWESIHVALGTYPHCHLPIAPTHTLTSTYPSPLRTQGPSAPDHQQTDSAPSARRFCFCSCLPTRKRTRRCVPRRSRTRHETALAGCPFRRRRNGTFGRAEGQVYALGPCVRRDDGRSGIRDGHEKIPAISRAFFVPGPNA